MKNKVEFNCVLKDVLNIIDGKWSIPIIYVLRRNLKLPILLTEKLIPTVPPTVEYSLTSKGKKLEPIIMVLHKWGEEFHEK